MFFPFPQSEEEEEEEKEVSNHKNAEDEFEGEDMPDGGMIVEYVSLELDV